MINQDEIVTTLDNIRKFDFIEKTGDILKKSYPARKKMIHCRPGRRSQPGHVTVPPLRE